MMENIVLLVTVHVLHPENISCFNIFFCVLFVAIIDFNIFVVVDLEVAFVLGIIIVAFVSKTITMCKTSLHIF